MKSNTVSSSINRTTLTMLEKINGREEKNMIEQFLGSDNTDLNSKLNIIENQHLLEVNEISFFNSIYSEYYGEMYYNFVIVRKFIFTNKEFLKHILTAVAKIVHPNIQIFYGLMFNKDSK